MTTDPWNDYVRATTPTFSAFLASYDWYLCESENWKTMRSIVWGRAGGICERCHVRRANHTHHTTYDRLFDERDTDLIAVCKACHIALHDEPDAPRLHDAYTAYCRAHVAECEAARPNIEIWKTEGRLKFEALKIN